MMVGVLTDNLLDAVKRVDRRAVVALSALALLGEVDDGLGLLAQAVEGFNAALGHHWGCQWHPREEDRTGRGWVGMVI
jgi:hypothetical protein